MGKLRTLVKIREKVTYIIADLLCSGIPVSELSVSPMMAEQLSREERLKLIYQNLQEVLKPGIIEQVVLKEDRPLKIYWGMAKLECSIGCNR